MQSTEKILVDLAKEIKCGSALYQNQPDKSDYYISRILTFAESYRLPKLI